MKEETKIDFYHQFILAHEAMPLPDSWVLNALHGFKLMTHQSLPVARILDRQMHHVGFVLGWPIDPTGKMVESEIVSDVMVGKDSEEDLEAFIYRFGGRFAFVLLTRTMQRLYLDAAGTLATVFSSRRRRAGSTVGLLVSDEPTHPIFSRKVEEFPGDRMNQFWPAGMTPDQEIRRLLPNHYLDLEEWRMVRHYPKKVIEPAPEHELPIIADQIANVVERNILASVQQASSTYIGLTAGRDTRMLLACAREFCDRIDFVTFDYRRTSNYWPFFADLHISEQIAKRLELKQTILPVEATAPYDVELEYMQRTGFSGHPGKAKDFFEACRKHLDLSGAWLTGFGGELARAYLWQEEDKNKSVLSPAQLLDRLRVPSYEPIEKAMSDWLNDLPDLPITAMLDLAWIEHDLGCWASTHLYGAAPFSVNLLPLCHREVFEGILRVPVEYRKQGSLVTSIIRRTWPELLSLPFNQYTGPKRWYMQVRMTMDRARRRIGL